MERKMLTISLLFFVMFSSYDSSAKHQKWQDRPIEDDFCCCPQEKKKDTFDYIVIGLGTAGAPLTRKLSDPVHGKFKNDVLALEWGQDRDADPAVQSPNLFAFADELTFSPKYATNYSVPVKLSPFGGDIFIYSNGHGWGGGSMHNAMFTVRGTDDLYNDWALATGDPRWLYNNLLPFMLGLEHYTPDGTIANPAQRGMNGPLFITQSPPAPMDPLAQAFSAGTATPLVSDYNDPTLGDIGIAVPQQYITPGQNSERSYSISAFLPLGEVVDAEGKGLHGRKLRIESKALVDRIIFKCGKAVGVRYIITGKKGVKCRTVYARKEIIISAGANQTTAILQRSGIGPKALLDSLGIDVVVDNPNVGAHLQNHYGPSARIAGAVTAATPFLTGNLDGNNPVVPDQGMPADGVRRIQFLGINLGPEALIVNTLMRPKSEGTIKIISTDPTIDPVIDFNFYSDGPVTQPGTDAYLVVDALKLMKNVADEIGGQVTAPAPELYPAPYGPAPDDSLLFDYAKNLVGPFLLANGTISYHNAGTARMAKSIADGVVDSKLRVFGVKNLMIADCSVEPFIQDGNTAYAAYLIGLVAADILGV